MTDVGAQRRLLVDWLRRRDPITPIELAETHISIIALQGERAYKLKKNVAFGFIDLSTPQRRARDCEREVALNRRFAPDVYLGVLDVTDPAGATVERVVEMRRMRPEDRLAMLAGAGIDAGPCLDVLAVDLAAAHTVARRGTDIDAAATRDACAQRWSRELSDIREYCGAVIDPADYREVQHLAVRYLQGRDRLFEVRIAAGRVCDGHGDLLADDVYCTEAGPRVLDCIEFDDRLRYADVLADVAFLAMDLERLGRRDLARRFLDQYRDAARDAWPASLEDHYIAYRALVRAKIACLRADQGAVDAAEHAALLFALTHAHLRESRVRLVLIGGPPGTGKSTVARGIAQATGWTVLRSDVVRKELAGWPPGEHAADALDKGLYFEAHTSRTYEAMLARAHHLVQLGISVVLDASWSKESWRARAAAIADDTSTDLVQLRCDVAADVAGQRIAERSRIGLDPSDADTRVANLIRSRFDPWPAASAVDTGGSVAETVASALHFVR